MKFKKLILSLFILLFVHSFSYAELFYLLGYPSQSKVIDTLRSGILYTGETEGNAFYEYFFGRSNFYSKGFVYSIHLFDGKPEFEYKVWMQPKPAPLVIIIPGTGATYLNSSATAIGENFYRKGCSVLIISSPFSWKFTQSASSVLTPGFTLQDSCDIYVALKKILYVLSKKYKNRITDKYLIGYSLGGLEILYIADLESRLRDSDKINFNRYLALNPPVDLFYSLKQIDNFFTNSRLWNKKQVRDKISKVGKLYQKYRNQDLDLTQKLPLTQDEAEYIIGVLFHMTLVEQLYVISQTDYGRRVMSISYSWGDRTTLYNYLDRCTFMDYIIRFLKPYYSDKLGIDLSIETLNDMSGLRAIENTLKTDPKIRVLHSANDFLLSEDDVKWMSDSFGEKLVLLNTGGHLGYLFYKGVSDLMYNMLILGYDSANIMQSSNGILKKSE